MRNWCQARENGWYLARENAQPVPSPGIRVVPSAGKCATGAKPGKTGGTERGKMRVSTRLFLECASAWSERDGLDPYLVFEPVTKLSVHD